MELNELYSKLNFLESQKQSIEQEILETKKTIRVTEALPATVEKLSQFSKQQKIILFKSLFIAREDVYPKYWVSKDGIKKGYSPVSYSFRGQDYVPINNNIIQHHLEG